MARVASTRKPRTTEPRTRKAVKPKEAVVVGQLSDEHFLAVSKAYGLVANKDLELKAAQHFLEKINDEIADTYDLPEKFTIDLANGQITEG